MMLTMRAKVFGNKLILMTAAFVLSISALTAVTPFILAQRANALSTAGYTTIDPSAGWSVDRTAPSGGYGSEMFDGRQVLYMKVAAPSQAPSSFYQYEGISKAVNNGTQTLKADLYIDPSWPSNVRAGFWGVGYDTSGQLSSYPIVEYNTASSSTHWRIWDSTGNGGWRDVVASSATSGWNTIELAIDTANSSKTDVYVNNSLIGASATDPTVDFHRVILNNYNFGNDSYTVRWSNIQAGVYKPAVPTNLHFVKDSTGATVASGSIVNYADITLRWNTVPNAERYQILVTDPTGASQSNRYTGWYTFDLNDASRYGFFGTQQGTWTYQVRTKDATTGLWSDYSAPLTLKFDSVAPTTTVKANDIVLPENTSSSPVVYIPGSASTTFQATLTDTVSSPASAYIELFKANWNGTYGTWVKDNTSGVGNVRYGANPKLVYNTSALNGRYGLKIVSQDTVGNSKTTYYFFTIDNTIPTATFIFPTAGPSATSFKVQFSEAVNEAEATNPANYYLENWPGAGGSGVLTGNATVVYDLPTHVATVSFVHAGWYVSPEQKWGVKNIHDLAGNSIADTSAYSTSMVKPEITSGPTSSSPVNSLTQTWTWTGVDPTNATNASGIKGYEYAFVDASTTPSVWTSTSGTSATVTAPTDGTYRFYVRALDNAGNVGDSSYAEVALDTTPPQATITTFTSGLVAGTADTDAQVVVTVDGVHSAPLTPNADGSWSFAITPALTAGNHTATVTATDSAHNSFTTPTQTLAVNAFVVSNVITQPTTQSTRTTTLPSANTDTPGVLGVSDTASTGTTTPTTDPTGTPDVKGTSTEKTVANAVNNNDGKALGLAWYWWLLIAAGLATLVWWIVAAIRNRRDDDQ